MVIHKQIDMLYKTRKTKDLKTQAFTINKISMKSTRNTLLILISMLSFFFMEAQQDPQYTQYMYNTMSVNSAYAGTRGHASITGLHRSQWVGLDGAPRTQTLAIDAPVAKRVGLGLSVVNDELGPSEEFYTDLNFAYTIPVSEDYKLSFGLKGGFRLFNLDFNKGTQKQSGDEAFQSLDNKVLPTVGAGLYLFSKNKYIGLSTPNFLKDEHYDRELDVVAAERLHLFLIAGWVFDVGDNTKFKPTVLVKHVEGSPLSVDLSANFLLYERFRLGLGYRWDDSISGLLGFQISKNLLIAYAYDYTTTDLNEYNSGTHEIALRFDIFKDKILKSPRFF